MMGVLPRVDRNGVAVQEEPSMVVAQSSSPAQDIPTPESKNSPRHVPRKNKKYVMCRKWEHARNMKKGRGVRQTRRADDLNDLLSLVDELEEVDIVEPTCSAFTALFLEHEKMKIWNDFLNRPEETQQELLQHGMLEDEDDQDVSDDSFEKIDGVDNETDEDGRKENPAFSAEECYSRIDSRLRTFLNKSHVPLGTLEHLEKDLLLFFNDYPTSVLITKLGSSFERMLLHALCQYLDLSSHSYDDKDAGGRHTQVENKQEQFTPPNMTLTQYLEQAV